MLKKILVLFEDDYGNAVDTDCVAYGICGCTVTCILSLLACVQLRSDCHWSHVHGLWMYRAILPYLLSSLFQQTSDFTSLRAISLPFYLSTFVVLRADCHLSMWNRLRLHAIRLWWCVLSIRGMFYGIHQKCSGEFLRAFLVRS